MNCYSYVGTCSGCKGLYEYLNIRNHHWAFCDRCKTRLYVGKDLFPSWRAEAESIWRANEERIKDFTVIGNDPG